MRTALVVDHPQRDLPGLVLVARVLLQQGVEVFVVPYNLAEKELTALAPDSVLLPHLRRLDQSLAEKLLDSGIDLIILDTEGGVVESLGTYGRMFSDDRSILSRVSMYCSWGPRIGDYLLQSGRLRQDQVVVTGSPRFDFYRKPWLEFAGRASGEGSSRPMVLVIGTFSLANPRFRSPDEEAEFLVEKADWDRDLITRRRAAEEQCFAGIVKLCNDLSAWRSDVDWVLRPHPFENPESYREQLSDSVQVVAEGTVDTWIHRSTVLIHRGSTTAVEATLAGVPVLTPNWLPEWAQVKSVSAVSQECSGLEELKKILGRILDRPLSASTADFRIQEELGGWFGHLDGKAYRRVAECILKLFDSKDVGDQTSIRRCREAFYGLHDPGISWFQSLSNRLRMLLRIPAGFSFRHLQMVDSGKWWDASAKRFGSSELMKLLDALDAVDGQGTQPHQENCAKEAAVQVALAGEAGSYRVPFPFGRSVVMRRKGRL